MKPESPVDQPLGGSRVQAETGFEKGWPGFLFVGEKLEIGTQIKVLFEPRDQPIAEKTAGRTRGFPFVQMQQRLGDRAGEILQVGKRGAGIPMDKYRFQQIPSPVPGYPSPP